MKSTVIDFETRSAVDLKKWGMSRYAEDSTTDAICLAVKPRGFPPLIWYAPKFREGVGLPMLTDEELKDILDSSDILVAHNAGFEYCIFKYVMTRYGFPMLDASKFRCSAAKAAMHNLPRPLEQACLVLGVREQKDMEGSRLMMQLCKPRKPLKAEVEAPGFDPKRLYWRGDAADFTRLGQYCMQDVRAEEAFDDALSELPDTEQKLWQLDLQINDRGVHVDVPACQSVLNCLATHETRMVKEFSGLTGLSSPRQRDATLKHLVALGVEMDGLTVRDVEKALAATENETAKAILRIRQSLAKSSTAKYTAFMGARNSDDRIRFCLMYHGAATGRWTGKIIQPQNFPRGEFSDVEGAIALFEAGDLTGVDMLYGDPMAAAATCIRGMITPAPGNEFICADYSSIEGRVLAWLSGEETALDVYRQGRDPYKVAAQAIYHVEYDEVDKDQRRIGKVSELACGYQGGANAFNRMGENYGVTLPEKEAKEIVEKWRANRPETVRFWGEMEKMAIAAVSNPGKVYKYRAVKMTVRGRFLMLRLPSDRCLYYSNPRIEDKAMPWGGMKPVVSYEGVDSYTRKWCRQYLYGGLLTENVTQATARDIMAGALPRVEEAGYPVVMHVHDEVVSEPRRGFGSVEEFESLLCVNPAWAPDLPLKAEGWRGFRYKK